MPLDNLGFYAEGPCVGETDNAIGLLLDGDKVWFPLSQVKKITRMPNGGPVTVWIPPWLAQKKGLLDNDESDS